MLQLKDNNITFDYALCQQCGICQPICPKGAISFESIGNKLSHINIDNEKCVMCGLCVKTCPASYNHHNPDYFDDLSNKGYFLCWNDNDSIRRKASSGGVARTLIHDALANDKVDGVYSLISTNDFPYAEGHLFTKDKMDEINQIPNSIYHSVMMCRNIKQTDNADRLMAVGTACQLRAIENAIGNKHKDLIKVCIFCKQQKTIQSTRFMAKVMGTSIGNNGNDSIRYRGEGWPGQVAINGKKMRWNKAATIPFGRRLWTVPGCKVCGDPFGKDYGADISLMDPWDIRKENDLGETLVITHSLRGAEMIKGCGMLKNKQLTFNEAKPALDLKDISRKRQMVDFFRKGECKRKVIIAGKCETLQTRVLEGILGKMPNVPYLLYRAANKIIPDLRNLILH